MIDDGLRFPVRLERAEDRFATFSRRLIVVQNRDIRFNRHTATLPAARRTRLRSWSWRACVSVDLFVQFPTILTSRVEGMDVDERGKTGEIGGAGHRLENLGGDLGVVCFTDPYR